MAALSITATNVSFTSGQAVQCVIGETVTAGQAVYIKAADGRVWLAQADGTSAEATAVGVMLNGGAAGQYGNYAANGSTINIGATTAKNVMYHVHGTAGSIGVAGDLSSGNYVTRMGYATDTAGAFVIDIKATGVTV
jgi:hypothetical protein